MTRPRLCGPGVEAPGPDGAPVELPGRQLPVLFARLAIADGAPVGRDDLVTAVWGEDAPPSATRTLAALLSRLRALLGPGAVVLGDAVRLDGPAAEPSDVHDLRASLAAAEAALADGDPERAATLARRARDAVSGPFLAGHTGVWAVSQRELVAADVARAYECEAAALLVMGDARALGPAQAAVAHDPFRERAVVLLVDAHLTAGDPASALRAYEALRHRLRDDLGTVPGPRARAAHRRALEAELGTQGVPVAQLAGRDAELARADAWRDAAGGLSVLVVSGEPGIGLSAFVAAVAARARAAGWLVAAGTCPAVALEDHAGVAELLRDLVAQLDDADLRAVAPSVARLAPLVPALGADASGTAAPAGNGGGDAAAGLGIVVATLLRAAARGQQVLLVLEDLESAEPATRRLLQDALTAGRGAGVRVVLTAHGRADGVGAMLGALRRSVDVHDLELGRLRREDVEVLAARHGPDGGLPDAVTEELWQATCGHPLLLVELLRDLATQPAAGLAPTVRVAPAVRQLVLDASLPLPPSARQVLALLAAAGRPLPGTLIAAAFRRDPADVAADLAAARDRALVSQGADGSADFAVPVIGRAIREDLDPLDLRGLNLRLARAAAEEPPGRPGSRVEVALHLLAAGELSDPEEVARAVVAAAREALDDRDPARAADLAARALALVGPGPLALRLGVLLAEARYRGGDAVEARRIRLRVAADARAAGDRDAQLLAALDHDRPLETGEHHPADQAMLEGLLDVLPAHGPARVAAVARLAVVAHHGPSWERHLHRADEALRLAHETEDPLALARALAAKRFDAQRPGFSLVERRALTAELARAAVAAGWSAGGVFAAWFRTRDRWEAGDGIGFRAELRALRQRVEPLREPFWLLPLRCLQASEAAIEGRFAEAELRLRDLGAEVGGARGDVAASQIVGLSAVLRLQGRLGELLPAVEGLPRNDARAPHRAAVLAHAGRSADARALLDELAADGWTRVRRDVLWALSAGALADAVIVSGATEHAAHWYAELLPLAGTAITGPSIAWLPVDLLLGGLAGGQGDDGSAAAHLARATAVARSLQAPVYEREAEDALRALGSPR